MPVTCLPQSVARAPVMAINARRGGDMVEEENYDGIFSVKEVELLVQELRKEKYVNLD